MNFPLYTLDQNLNFSEKVNNSIKYSARVTNNVSNIRHDFALFFCNTKFKLYHKSISKITNNQFLYFCLFHKIFGGKIFQKLNG